VSDLFGILGELFELVPYGERTFESNPCDMTPDKARAIHKAGFNRVSLGVQSMDNANRLRQDAGVVSAAIEQIHATGID
jgi:oxygen-independent coproporphyrinogen-3 oxidase